MVTCSVPDYKKTCTSVFTEGSRLTGEFCSSISGIVTAPTADSSTTARSKAVGTLCRCRTRLRKTRLSPESGLAWAEGEWTVSCFELLRLASPMDSFPEWFTVIGRFRNCDFEHRNHAGVFGSNFSVDVHHSFRCVLSAVLCRFRTRPLQRTGACRSRQFRTFSL